MKYRIATIFIILSVCQAALSVTTPIGVGVTVNNQSQIDITSFAVVGNNTVCCSGGSLPPQYTHGCGYSCGKAEFQAVVVINDENCQPFVGSSLPINPLKNPYIQIYQKGDFNCATNFCCSIYTRGE